MGDTADSVWQDSEVRFDVPTRAFLPHTGELSIDSINAVEDTKGNNGMRGSLSVTNLRLLWCAHKSPKLNLSIGLNCVLKLRVKTANSKLRGRTQALYVICSFHGTRFEFVFTSLVSSSPRLFTTVQAVHRAYDTSRLYRELKLRGAIIRDKQLKTLPDEDIYQKLSGVWNLSSDQGNLGTFFITNIRLVWFADLASNFNVSIPFLRIADLRFKESKFGEALVVETEKAHGGYVLGFRMDPKERLHQAMETIQNLHRVFAKTPNFGVAVSYEAAPSAGPVVAEKRVEEDLSLHDDDDASYIPASFSAGRGKDAYVTQRDVEDQNPPTYDAKIGLAVEPLPKGKTVASLWAIMSF